MAEPSTSNDPQTATAVDQLASLQAVLAQRDAQITTLTALTAATTAKYRTALLSSLPDLPPELVAGATHEEVDASVERAKATVEAVKARLAAQPASPLGFRPPAGGNGRTAPDTSTMTAAQKIAHALNNP